MKKIKTNKLKALAISLSIIVATYLFQGILTLISLLNINLNLPDFFFSILIFMTILRPLTFLFVIYFEYNILEDLINLYKLLKESKSIS